ncbi:MAG: 3',5'-cyclic-nucleotide phosphodiesterase [Pyrinomonadaceae bacterium]
MKLQMLPSSIDENGKASARQYLLTIVVDDRVAIDAGCLAFSCTDAQRRQIRDVVLTHPHLDHIAGLPMFIDDLFASIEEPLRIHATAEIIEILERDVFNWAIYPRFSELSNQFGPVVEYRPFVRNADFSAAHLSIESVAVNHKVSANGFIVSDGKSSVAITGDTGPTDEIWRRCRQRKDISAILVECAFPNEMQSVADVSHHLTPARLRVEIDKLGGLDVPISVICIKPMYRERVIEQINAAGLVRVDILEAGKIYDF